VKIRRLQPGDEGILSTLAMDAAEFGLSDDGGPLTALGWQQAGRYLCDASVVHWVAFDADEVVGSLVTIRLPLHVSPGIELLLYEIGVRESWRRRGVGAALVRCMDEWMHTNEIGTVWVLADNEGATSFYSSCGFSSEPDQPRYMVRSTGENA
jgi:predicted N-acetyltransferase YhbS